MANGIKWQRFDFRVKQHVNNLMRRHEVNSNKTFNDRFFKFSRDLRPLVEIIFNSGDQIASL